MQTHNPLYLPFILRKTYPTVEEQIENSYPLFFSHSLSLYRIIHVPTIDGDNNRAKEVALRVDDFRIEFTWPLQLDIVRIRKKFVWTESMSCTRIAL